MMWTFPISAIVLLGGELTVGCDEGAKALPRRSGQGWNPWQVTGHGMMNNGRIG